MYVFFKKSQFLFCNMENCVCIFKLVSCCHPSYYFHWIVVNICNHIRKFCAPHQDIHKDNSIQYTFEYILKTKVLICTWLLLVTNRNYLLLKSYTRETIKQPQLYIKLSKGRQFIIIFFFQSIPNVCMMLVTLIVLGSHLKSE